MGTLLTIAEQHPQKVCVTMVSYIATCLVLAAVFFGSEAIPVDNDRQAAAAPLSGGAQALVIYCKANALTDDCVDLSNKLGGLTIDKVNTWMQSQTNGMTESGKVKSYCMQNPEHFDCMNGGAASGRK